MDKKNNNFCRKNEKNAFEGVVSEAGNDIYSAVINGEENRVKLKGSIYSSELRPIVGDVIEGFVNEFGEYIVTVIRERKNVLKRTDQSGHAAGFVKTMKEQNMVANYDYCFIVSSLNHDFSVNRIARYASVILEGGGIPVAILTKADRCDCIEERVREVKSLNEKLQVHAVSSYTGEGLAELSRYFGAGKTVVLIGSSGVGKSTLVNALYGKDVMKTSSVREEDSKGRHTTTHRKLFYLPDGTAIIDTPGMREIGVSSDESAVDDQFEDITGLAALCRFGNCRHDTEPGCAIKHAIEQGKLSRERFMMYKKLKSESRHAASKMVKRRC